jgi:hypothetical protein
MIAVGRPGIEADLGFKDSASCSGSDLCFQVGNPSRAMVGTNAGSFYGAEHSASGPGGAGCWVFLFEDSNGWHYVNGACAQSEGYVPGVGDRVFVTGCANFRAAPGLSAKVLGCLGNGTIVNVDSAPVYKDAHIWWHLAGRGWMAHDFLVAPKNCHC